MSEASLQNNLLPFIVIVTACLLSIFLAIVIFVFQYQRKMTQKSVEIAKNNLENQKLLLESSMLVKEAEMKRISRELHDGIGSEINALRLLIHNTNLPSEIKDELNLNCLKISKNISGITEELMPVTLEKFGLEAALESLFKSIQKVSKIDVNMSFEGEKSFDFNEIQSLSLYRIVQELTNNIMKHNNAKKLTFVYRQNESELRLTLIDDGVFFTPKGLSPSKRIEHGLLNIESRLQLIHGTISYEENKPSGTIVKMHLRDKCLEE